MTSFEDGLWERLVEEHDADLVSLAAPRERATRRPLLIGGGLTAVAAAGAAAVVGIGAATSAAPAYAMTQNTDGSISVTVYELPTAIPELNAKFAEMGFPETIVPIESNCRASTEPVAAVGRLVPLPTAVDDAQLTGEVTLVLSPPALSPGYTGVVAVEQLPDGGDAVALGTMKLPTPSCFPTAAYTTQQAGTGANGVSTVTETTVASR
jgi:hypothetical protein